MSMSEQVEIFDETGNVWLVFDSEADADEYALNGNDELIADIVGADPED